MKRPRIRWIANTGTATTGVYLYNEYSTSSTENERNCKPKTSFVQDEKVCCCDDADNYTCYDYPSLPQDCKNYTLVLVELDQAIEESLDSLSKDFPNFEEVCSVIMKKCYFPNCQHDYPESNNLEEIVNELICHLHKKYDNVCNALEEKCFDWMNKIGIFKRKYFDKRCNLFIT